VNLWEAIRCARPRRTW